MAEVFRSNGQDFYIPKITISLVNEADTERCLLFLFGSIPSLLKVQRIAKIFVFYRCCDSLHLVAFFESQMLPVAVSFEAKVQKIAKICDCFFDYCLRSSALLIDLWDYLGYDYIGSLCPKFRADLFDIVGDFFLISISLKENCYGSLL